MSRYTSRRENTRDNHDEFRHHYRRVLDDMQRLGVKDAKRAALRFTLWHVSPGYHVSYERAYTMVCRLLSGRHLPPREQRRLTVWHDIASHVSQVCADTGLSLARATELVLDHCRPRRFYMSADTARTHVITQHLCKERCYF